MGSQGNGEKYICIDKRNKIRARSRESPSPKNPPISNNQGKAIKAPENLRDLSSPPRGQVLYA